MHGLLLFKPVAVAMLILANGYFAAAEFALVAIRESRVEQLLEAQVPGARAVPIPRGCALPSCPPFQSQTEQCAAAAGGGVPIHGARSGSQPLRMSVPKCEAILVTIFVPWARINPL